MLNKTTDQVIPNDNEYQLPATKRYHGLPLFLRRYPEKRDQNLEDIKNGRPIIIVEHAKVFKDGYDKITELVDWVNTLGNVKWVSLGKIAEYYASKWISCEMKLTIHKLPFMDRVKVLLRRILSEFRDCYFHTNHFTGRLYRLIISEKK